MKKYILILITVFAFTAVQGQEKSNSKIKETSFEVKGVCGECKARIENAAMHTKGVKKADWNKETKELKLVYNSQKVDLETVKKAIASKGHDTDTQPTDSTSYAKLPGCCKYKDGAKCGH